MSKWLAKDVIKVFADEKTIERMYRYRFMAFVLVNVDRYNKLQGVNIKDPGKENLQTSIDGCNDILKQFDELVKEDAAVYSTMHAKKTDKGYDLKALSADIEGPGKEINKKYVANAEKNNPTFKKDFEFLQKTQDTARKNAIKMIQNGEKIETDEFNQRILLNTMGKNYADAMLAGSKKYQTWKNVTSTEAFSNFAQSKQGSEWFNDAKYGSLKAAGKAAKDKIYDTVMEAETNFLSAPVKLFFFGMHEILNPNSTLRNMLGNFRKWKENKEANEKYKELGLNTGDNEGSTPEEENKEITKRSATKSIKEVQRELIKGYDFKKDLEDIGYDEKRVKAKKDADAKKEQEEKAKKEKEQQAKTQQAQPAQSNQQQKTKSESWIREANEEKEADKQVDVGEDEPEDTTQTQPTEQPETKSTEETKPLSKEELTKLQDKMISVIFRYNCLIYFMMRAFAGAYGQMKDFAQFSFHPFTISDNKEHAKQWKKEDFDKIKQFFSSEEGKKYGIKDLNAAKNLTSDKKQAVYNELIAQDISGAALDKILGTVDGVAESITFADYVQNMVLEANQKVVDPYLLTLTKGVDHWIKKDVIMSRLIQRNQKLKVELQKNSKFSTFFAYARLFEDFIQEYSTYIDGIESNPNYEQIKHVDLKLTGIKNLKLIECTANLQKSLAYLSNHTNGNLKSEVRREFIALSMFKKITNITSFLTIRDMNFKNMKAFFKLVLPKMEMLRRPTATSCTLSKETASTVFGEKGIPYSVLNQSMDEEKEKAEKLYKGV